MDTVNQYAQGCAYNPAGVFLKGDLVMRLAITRSGFYNADMYCADTRTAKKHLRESYVSILAVDYYLAGRENGDDLIRWAQKNDVLPNFVVVIERNREKRGLLANSLKTMGYRSCDELTFVRH